MSLNFGAGGVPWMAKKTNKWILDQASPLTGSPNNQTEALILDIFRLEPMHWKTIMLGSVEGNGGIRPATRGMETIRGIMNQPFRNLKTKQKRGHSGETCMLSPGVESINHVLPK